MLKSTGRVQFVVFENYTFLLQEKLHEKLHDKNINRIYNKILDRDWFSARLFVT